MQKSECVECAVLATGFNVLVLATIVLQGELWYANHAFGW